MVKRSVRVHLVVFVFALSVCFRADAQALPAFTGAVNKAIGRVISTTAVRRGFAANDPLINATFGAVSGELATAAGSAAAAAVAATTAPVWLSVAAFVGAAAVVGGLAYGAYKVLFGDSSSPAQFTVQKPSASGTAMPTVAPPTWTDYSGSNQSLASASINGRTVYLANSADSLNQQNSTAAALTFDSNGYFIRSGEQYAMAPVYSLGSWYTSLVGSSGPITLGDAWAAWVQAQGGSVTVQPSCVASGASVYTCSISYRFPWSGADINFSTDVPVVPNPYYAAPASTVKGSVSDIYSQLDSSELAKPADDATVAQIANSVWQQAASRPGYAGVPYSASDPVTAADAAAARQANPSSWPTNADLLSPVASAAGAAVPVGDAGTTASGSTSGSTNPAIGTNVNVVNTPNVNVANKVQVDFGDAPNVGSPALEDTPTASAILAPLTSLMPTLKSFVVPGHSSVCPTGTFTVFDQAFVVDSHCSMAETVRPTLYAAMAFVWVALAAFIVLKA